MENEPQTNDSQAVEDTEAEAPIEDVSEERGDSNGERQFTQSQVNEMLAKQKRKLRAEKRSDGERKPSKLEAKKQEGSGRSDIDDRLLRLDFRDALDDRELSLPRKQRAKLERVLSAMAPDDVDEFIDDFVVPLLGDSAEGAERKEKNTQTKGADEGDESEDMRETRDRGGAREVRDFDALEDPNGLTEADIKLLERKHGRRKAHDMVRTMAEGFYKGKRIALHDR